MDTSTSRLKKVLTYISLAVIVVTYLVLRLGWSDTIEFGYDQPLLSLRVLDFLKNPTFINSYKFVGQNPWGYPSWGPMQIFFYAPFFLISKNPLVLSLLIASFNVLSIFTVFVIGKKFFSLTVGLIAALILATHPWWIVFSRMIYQPTPVITFISLSMFLSFLYYKKQNNWIIMPLFLTWAILFQLYIHTASFIVVSILFFLKSIRRISYRYLTVGLFSIILIFLPVVFYYFKLPNELAGFIDVSKKFTFIRTEDNFSNLNIISGFLQTVAGGGFRWQLGYAYKEFIDKFELFGLVEIIGALFFTVVLTYHFFALFFQKEKRILRVTLLLWLIGPILFLILIHTPIALPRYFLQSLPSLAILLGIFVEEVSKKFARLKMAPQLIKILPIFLGLYWVIFVINYYKFIENYSYPRGFLSNYSDVPYSFLKKSLNWIVDDAKKSGFSNITISQDPKNPTVYSPVWAAKYVLENPYDKNFTLNGSGKTGHYLLYLTPAKEDLTGRFFAQFGPYLVYRH